MFAPGEEPVKRYADGIVTETDPRHRATQELIRTYALKNFTGNVNGQRARALLLVFRGEKAAEKKLAIPSVTSFMNARAGRQFAILSAIT